MLLPHSPSCCKHMQDYCNVTSVSFAFLLLQGFGDMSIGMYDSWYEEVPIEEVDKNPEPRYVNGKRVLVNREIT